MELMIHYSSNTEHLHIFTFQFGTFWIENFHLDWWKRPYNFACSFHLVYLSGDMKGAVMFCHYPAPCLIMLSWCLPCLQMCGLNLNLDMLCARLVPVYVLLFLWQESSVKSSWADSPNTLTFKGPTLSPSLGFCTMRMKIKSVSEM